MKVFSETNIMRMVGHCDCNSKFVQGAGCAIMLPCGIGYIGTKVLDAVNSMPFDVCHVDIWREF